MAILKIRDKNGNIVNVPAIKGQSAYEIARDNGFEGNEQEWIDSLKGNQGKSAYQYAQDGGFTSTDSSGVAYSPYFCKHMLVCEDNVEEFNVVTVE